MRRSLAELTDVAEPAWPLVQGWIAEATNQVEVLPPAATRADTLSGLQVTLWSALGAIAYETGGLLVDHGWVRVLGSGHPRLPRELIGWNQQCLGPRERPYWLVADDVIGGFYALDVIAWGTAHVHYFAPDNLAWEDTGLGYGAFVEWLLTGDLDGYYADYRWSGWQAEVEGVVGDRAYSIAPPPIAKDAPYAQRSRQLVPVAGLYALYQDLGRQLADVADGDWFVLRFKD
ncbi:MAG TPA: DUF2625 family protein [Kofleriaceae bacterium]|nr:DUF2625 family protein [Kofleriaceae bacterium]